MRLIDGDALINRIVFHTDLSQDVKESVEDEIENAPTVSQWIPCSERLPEEDGVYLVQLTTKTATTLSWADGWNCFRRHDGKVSRLWELDENDIVAWSFLPEPWKGEEK